MATAKKTTKAESAKVKKQLTTGEYTGKSPAIKRAVKAAGEAVAKKDSKTAFKLPKTLAECADLAYELREQRLKIQKEAEAVAKNEALLREHLIQTLPKSLASGVSGKVANAKIERKTVPQVTDKAKFLAYVKKTGQFDLISTSMNSKAVEDRWENKKKVPGVGEFQVVKLSLNKVR